MGRLGFNDKVSSVVVRSGNWQLCSDSGFRGQCITLSPGSYASMRSFGMNDRISSIRPIDDGGSSGGDNSWGGGWGGGNEAVVLYEHANYGGKGVNSLGNANFESLSFNDKVSSIIIRSGRWEFCTDKDYRGRCTTLGPGRYGNLSDMGLNDALSSFRPSGGTPSYGGRPNSTSWGGDDGSAPEISLSANRSGRATYRNGCVVYFSPDGQRFQNLPACHGQQIPRADEAMLRYRNEQGFERSDNEHPWVSRQPRGYVPNDSSPPEIVMGRNGEGEVIFRNNCVAYYNAQGRRHEQQPSCDRGQLRQADDAMAGYRREQGM